eukprot:scaffold275727_cov31-Prasinocladus_malaysianus.AAC.1
MALALALAAVWQFKSRGLLLAPRFPWGGATSIPIGASAVGPSGTGITVLGDRCLGPLSGTSLEPSKARSREALVPPGVLVGAYGGSRRTRTSVSTLVRVERLNPHALRACPPATRTFEPKRSDYMEQGLPVNPNSFPWRQNHRAAASSIRAVNQTDNCRRVPLQHWRLPGLRTTWSMIMHVVLLPF